MISFIINAIKIIFLLGFLIIIHELGHFSIAKLFKVKVNEFSIGFGKAIWKKQGKETLYTFRIVPLGGYVQMEGESEESDDKRAFSNASIPKRIGIVIAGALVNIIFGIVLYFILVSTIGLQFVDPSKDTFLNRMYYGGIRTQEFIMSLFESIKVLFTGGATIDQMAGPVGISQIVTQTTNFQNYLYILSIISVSLGVTNLLPIPALDGGKIVLLLIEAIRRKKIKIETEATITLIGFMILIGLSLYVTYNDIIRILRLKYYILIYKFKGEKI